MSRDPQKTLAARIVRALSRAYPDATCALVHEDAFQLLVATILSAQCTDERVNQVTAVLFAQYPTVRALAEVSPSALEKLVQSTGFFRNKARSIRALCQELLTQHNGQVPADLERLVELPGVGRKTANVVLGTAFGLAAGVVVDTHVQRISRRLGLTEHTNPERIEEDLMRLLPRRDWIDYSHRVIHHGRRICKARKPLCDECPLGEICPRIGVTE